jgi:hypothetical protein
MRADFRREHQITWAHAEFARLRESFGDVVEMALHLVENSFTRGERLITIVDPEGRGIPGAICLTDRTEEGSLWRAELFPIERDDDIHVPTTKSIQHIVLQMRYNRCVHATYDSVIGRPSGDKGRPDFHDGVLRLLSGDIALHRRLPLGRADKVPSYARVDARSPMP